MITPLGELPPERRAAMRRTVSRWKRQYHGGSRSLAKWRNRRAQDALRALQPSRFIQDAPLHERA